MPQKQGQKDVKNQWQQFKGTVLEIDVTTSSSEGLVLLFWWAISCIKLWDTKGDHATISTDASKELLCSMYSNQFLRIWDRMFTSDDLLGNQARGWRRTLAYLTFMAGCVWSSCTFKLIQYVLVVSVIILEWWWRERETQQLIVPWFQSGSTVLYIGSRSLHYMRALPV